MQSSFTPPATTGWFSPKIVTKTDAFTAAGDDAWHDITGLTGLSVTTTTSTQRVELIVAVMISASSTFSSAIRLVRDSTPIGIGDAASNRIQCTFGNVGVGAQVSVPGASIFHDAPAAAGTYTYKVQYLCESGGSIFVNRDAQDSDVPDLGCRGISSLRAQVFEP